MLGNVILPVFANLCCGPGAKRSMETRANQEEEEEEEEEE